MTAPTLVAFLTARLDDDESFALSAQAEASLYDEVRWHWLVAHGNGSRWHPTTATPARVLADVAAKRAIVAIYRHIDMGEGADGEPVPLGGDGPETYYETVRHLATAYADHPDYREEWRP